MTPNRARLSNITRNVINIHGVMGAQAERIDKLESAQAERIARLEKQMEAMQAQMQTTTPKRKYTTIQDGSPEDKFVEDAEATTIYCHTDLQEIIEDLFPQVADVLCFISDYEAERNRYYAKKQRCNAEYPAQPTDANILGDLADNL